MALTADNVVVAGSGAMFVADAGTALPTTLAAPGVGWTELGYVNEDGVTFTLSRNTDDLNAWQSSVPIRQLVNSEPKTIAATLLEFANPAVIELALRGGSIDTTAGVAKVTPPAAGASDIRALVFDAIDGDSTFRFCFEAVELADDVALQFVKSDATGLPLSFAVDAGDWYILSDHPTFVAAGAIAGSTSAAAIIEAIGETTPDESLELLVDDKRKTVREAAQAELERRQGTAG